MCLGVAALAAAAFILSYSAIHAFALQAGVQPRLARAFPVMVDAMLVLALAAVLALGGAGLPSRLLAWVILLVVLAAAAGADGLHAAGRKLPDHVAAVTVAILPWALVLLAFVLLLAMLRHARLRRQSDNGRGRLAASSAAPDIAPDIGVPTYTPPAIPAQPELLPTRPAQAAFTYGSRQGATRPEAGPPWEPAPPQDAVPQDAVPQDAVPGDTAPREAELPVADSLWDRLAGPRWETREPAQHKMAPDADAASKGAASDGAMPDGLAGDDPVTIAGTVEEPETPASNGVTQAEAVQAEPVQAEPVQAEPVQAEPVQAQAVQPEAVQPEPVQPEPVQPEPAPPEAPAADVPVQVSSPWERLSHSQHGDDAGQDDLADADEFSPAITDVDDHQDPDMPVFHRLWSPPTPPDES